MTTIVVVSKGKQIAIAADSQTTFGDDQKLLAAYDAYSNKIFRVGDSYLAIAGSAAHDLVLQAAQALAAACRALARGLAAQRLERIEIFCSRGR